MAALRNAMKRTPIRATKKAALKIAQAIKEGLIKIAPDVRVRIRRGYGDNFWVWVISQSQRWKRLSRVKRLDLVDDVLDEILSTEKDSLPQITVLFAVTPEELEELKYCPYYFFEEDENLAHEDTPSRQAPAKPWWL